jgi:hypothetical protein
LDCNFVVSQYTLGLKDRINHGLCQFQFVVSSMIISQRPVVLLLSDSAALSPAPMAKRGGSKLQGPPGGRSAFLLAKSERARIG